MKASRSPSILVLLLLFSMAAVPATAQNSESVVAEWNRHALAALVNPATAPVPGMGQPPTVAVLHMAMVQGAVYDAVNAVVGGYEPYLDGVNAAPGANQSAAAATAAYRVLIGLNVTPPLTSAIRDRLALEYADALAAVPSGAAKDAGIAVGQQAASAMLAARTGDGRYPGVLVEFPVGTETGDWRPGRTGNDPFSWVADVRPFVIESASQFRTDGPLPVNSAAYTEEYNEVKALGARTGSSRTAEQEALANFFAVNPIELHNRTLRTVAGERGLSIADEARLLARVNLAGADAIIGCWDDKMFWSFWRPSTAIQLGDSDGNPDTIGDPAWLPKVLPHDPPYPDHPSGYNCVTSAMMHTASDFFGPKHVGFTMTLASGAQTRQYARFTDVVKDTIDARIYLGLHFRTPDVQGAVLGKQVAHWVDQHAFGSAD